MQPCHDDKHKHREHAPKIELVHHSLRVVAAKGIEVKGCSMPEQVEAHEGNRNQEVLLGSARDILPTAKQLYEPSHTTQRKSSHSMKKSWASSIQLVF